MCHVIVGETRAWWQALAPQERQGALLTGHLLGGCSRSSPEHTCALLAEGHVWREMACKGQALPLAADWYRNGARQRLGKKSPYPQKDALKDDTFYSAHLKERNKIQVRYPAEIHKVTRGRGEFYSLEHSSVNVLDLHYLRAAAPRKPGGGPASSTF